MSQAATETFQTLRSWRSEEHAALSDSVRRFFAEECAPHIGRWANQGHVDRDVWLKAGDAGLLGIGFPEHYGGAGGDPGHEAVLHYEQGRSGDASLGLSPHTTCAHYILACGTEAQRRRWLPDLLSGRKVGAIALTEPHAGSDLAAVRTVARREGELYVIDGSKTFISNGVIADLIIVVAKTDPDAGHRGVSLFVIDGDADGLSRGRNLDKIGLRGSDTAELFFDGLRVDRDRLLGEDEGRGFYQLMAKLAWERLLMGLVSLGFSDCALEATISYARDRRVFGQRLMDLQNTRFRLAEAKTHIEILRVFLDDCVGRLLRQELDPATAAMAKWWSTDIQGRIVDDCVQIHGGYGFTNDYVVGRLYRDTRVQRIAGGANEIMKEIIARSLDGEGAKARS